MTSHRSGSIILLSFLLCVFLSTQLLLLSAVHTSDQRGLVVSVESPREDTEYVLGEIVPVKITVADSNGLAITNATVEVTSHYDMQYVHVPLLEVTRENQSEVAVYAPDPNISPPQGNISEAALVQLNDQGFLRLPSSEGQWWVTLQVRPLSPQGLLLPYERQIEIHVRAQPSTSLYLIVAGWICVIAVGIFLFRRRIKSSGETRRKRARHKNLSRIMTASPAAVKNPTRLIDEGESSFDGASIKRRQMTEDDATLLITQDERIIAQVRLTPRVLHYLTS